MGRRGARRAGRRTARRTARRTTHRAVRRTRRRRRRRILVGGAVLLAVGGAAYGAIKLSQKDSDRIEEYTGASVEELSEEELIAAMQDLGIQSIELTDDDKAIISDQGDRPPEAPAAEQPTPKESYLDELERLADLRDRGIISEDDFEAKKQQLLGL